jgi:hypothetical protein
MPRQREEERQGGQHSNGSEFRMHGVGEIVKEEIGKCREVFQALQHCT